jgi:hypothetical protein
MEMLGHAVAFTQKKLEEPAPVDAVTTSEPE